MGVVLRVGVRHTGMEWSSYLLVPPHSILFNQGGANPHLVQSVEQVLGGSLAVLAHTEQRWHLQHVTKSCD